jgi:hypothetical protein
MTQQSIMLPALVAMFALLAALAFLSRDETTQIRDKLVQPLGQSNTVGD